MIYLSEHMFGISFLPFRRLRTFVSSIVALATLLAPLSPFGAASAHAATMTYDANGNLTTTADGVKQTWDYNNRLLTSGSTSYAYDAFGQRIKMTTPSGTTYYPSKYFSTDGTTVTKYIYAGDQLVATVTGSGASAIVHYVTTDHLSSPNLITDPAGVPEEILDYYPYGGIRFDQKTGSFTTQKKFTGYQYDPETGLNYANARYQDPMQGRFISQDPSFLAIGDPRQVKAITGKDQQTFLMDPQSLNAYSYARNNPIKNTDPTGNATLFATLFNPLVPFFKLSAFAAQLAGRSATAELLNRSSSLNPGDTYAGDGSNVVNAIQAASEYRDGITHTIQKATSDGKTSFSGESLHLKFNSGDAQTSIGKVDLYVNGTMQKDGSWNLSVSGADKYDFDADHKSGTGLVGTAANAAYKGQQTGALSNYTTTIQFQQTVKPPTQKKGK